MIAVSFAELVEHVAFETGIEASQIVGGSRRAPVRRARAATVWLNRDLRGGTLRASAAALARTPAGVSGARREADRLLRDDVDFRRMTQAVRHAMTALAADRDSRR